MRVVEICVETARDAGRAEVGGAARVELCADRHLDGRTPERHDTVRACRSLKIPVHVLIRPREGDFVYSPREFDEMRRQIDEAGEAGAAGVVFGILTSGNLIDLDRNAWLIEHARPMSVTFHKAFDLLQDALSGLDEVVSLRVDRVLTSGHAPTARQGLGLLRRLAERAAGRITVMAGGGVAEPDLVDLRATGITEIHAGSSVAPGGQVDPGLVRSLVEGWKSPGPG